MNTIDRYGYDPKTITEDIEYTAISLQCQFELKTLAKGPES